VLAGETPSLGLNINLPTADKPRPPPGSLHRLRWEDRSSWELMPVDTLAIPVPAWQTAT
jgi:hypothetical protein